MIDLKLLVDELRKLPTETSWVEFKHNNFKPYMIGEDVSALANAAASIERECAYMVWGVENATHEVLGCRENLQSIKIGNEELENWLRHQLSPNADFEFGSVDYAGRRMGVLTIRPARHLPVAFKKEIYIRVGSYTKKLRDYPELERKLWRALDAWEFELEPAMKDLAPADILQLIDVGTYFAKLKIPQPTDFSEVVRIAVREFLANALIHQDFCEKGQTPLVEVFDDRIEFTNSGRLLVDEKRIVDTPPRARNEKLSALMRRMHMCEEAGSGWDKAVRGCEEMGLPGHVPIWA